MQSIEVSELAAVMADPTHRAWQLLDVREPWELATAKIPNTVAISMQQIVQRYTELDPDKITFCLCHHGTRSMQVGYFLERQGFASVVNVAGGIDAWSRQVDETIPLY